MDGKYIYGIIKANHDATLRIFGLDGSSPVRTIAHQEVGCVLSHYSSREFSSMSKEEVVKYLLTHQMVVEHIMREHTVLPVKFGTILAGSEEVRNMLSQGHQQFADALSRIGDKVEVEVAAIWDTNQVLQEISGEEEIVRTRDAIAGRPEQTLEDRIRLGQMVKVSMDRRRDSYRERMIDYLRPVAVDVQPNALVSDELVMNVAFLVEKGRQQEFDARVGQLDDLFRGEINFRIVAPLPPYSFATVEVSRPSPEKIKEARRLLDLGETISEPEVRKAYRRLAAETHPDRKPGDELATSQFAKLRQASELLVAYCRSQAESGGSFLINIRRLKDDEVQHFRSIGVGGLAGGIDG